jgi:hypothetical protein
MEFILLVLSIIWIVRGLFLRWPRVVWLLLLSLTVVIALPSFLFLWLTILSELRGPTPGDFGPGLGFVLFVLPGCLIGVVMPFVLYRSYPWR